MANQSTLPNALLRRARSWAGQMTSLAKAHAPNHLKEHIHSFVEPNSESPVYTIKTYVDNKLNAKQKYGTADAYAQEHGSGERSRTGSKGKITIVPKNAPFLQFLGTNAFDGWLIRTQKVQSPGIAPYGGEGYFRPAAKELRKRLREELDETVRGAIRVDIREAFSNANRNKR